jgi:hypothetical protein
VSDQGDIEEEKYKTNMMVLQRYHLYEKEGKQGWCSGGRGEKSSQLRVVRGPCVIVTVERDI